MNTWIFQANADRFKIDEFLASGPIETTWTVSRYKDDIKLGDQVFLWRAGDAAGIVAEARIVEEPRAQFDDENSKSYWVNIEDNKKQSMRTRIRFVRTANKREYLKKGWLVADPKLQNLSILNFAQATNFKVSDDEAQRIGAMWANTGNDWTYAESIAGLHAYLHTMNGPISKKNGPVVDTALLIGRAVTGVYNKVMNFRAIDPNDTRAGLSGASSMDKEVWRKFFDAVTGRININELDEEFDRLWASDTVAIIKKVDAVAEAVSFEREIQKLTKLTLEQLFGRLNATGRKQNGFKNQVPKTRNLSQRVFERDPLIVAITKRFADFKCEVPGCQHSSFQTDANEPYVCSPSAPMGLIELVA